MIELSEVWTKETPYLVEIGECVRQEGLVPGDVSTCKVVKGPAETEWKPLGYIDGDGVKATKAIDYIIGLERGLTRSDRLIRVSLFFKNNDFVWSIVKDPYLEQCKAWLKNAQNGLMAMKPRLNGLLGKEKAKPICKAIDEVIAEATCWERCGLREVSEKLKDDETGAKAFWDFIAGAAIH